MDQKNKSIRYLIALFRSIYNNISLPDQYEKLNILYKQVESFEITNPIRLMACFICNYHNFDSSPIYEFYKYVYKIFNIRTKEDIYYHLSNNNRFKLLIKQMISICDYNYKNNINKNVNKYEYNSIIFPYECDYNYDKIESHNKSNTQFKNLLCFNCILNLNNLKKNKLKKK